MFATVFWRALSGPNGVRRLFSSMEGKARQATRKHIIMETPAHSQVMRPRSLFFHFGALALLGVIDLSDLVRRKLKRYGWWPVGLLVGGILLGMLGVSLYALHLVSVRSAEIMNSAIANLTSGLEIREQVSRFEDKVDLVRREEVESMPAEEVAEFRALLTTKSAEISEIARQPDRASLQMAFGTLSDKLLTPLSETGLDRSTTKETYRRLELASGDLRRKIAVLMSYELEVAREEMSDVQAQSDRIWKWIFAGWFTLFGLAVILVVNRLFIIWLEEAGALSTPPFGQ